MSPLDIPAKSVSNADRSTGSFHARDVIPCGRYWAVAQTHPQAERWAASSLTSRGYRTFLPLTVARRRDRALPTLWHSVSVPLFPSYLFVILDGHWTPARYSPGVRDLLFGHDGRPARIGDAAIEAVRAAVGAAEARARGAEAWTAGAPCSVALGPLAGHPAVVLSVRGRNATVAVMLFGALREARVPVSALISRD